MLGQRPFSRLLLLSIQHQDLFLFKHKQKSTVTCFELLLSWFACFHCKLFSDESQFSRLQIIVHVAWFHPMGSVNLQIISQSWMVENIFSDSGEDEQKRKISEGGSPISQ